MSTLTTLYEQSKQYDEHKTDQLEYIQAMKFTPGGIALPDSLMNSAVQYSMTDWALEQACTKMGDPPAPYAKRCPDWLRADNLEHWRKQQPEDKKWFIRSYKDDCRAVLSNDYTPLSTTDLLKWTIDYAGDQETYRAYLTPDTFHAKIIMLNPNPGNGEPYGFGGYLGNGEIGNRYVRVLPMIQLHSCTNSIIIKDVDYEQAEGCVIMHRFKSTKSVELRVKEALGNVFRVAYEKLEEIAQAAIDELPNFNDLVEQYAKRKNLSQEVTRNVFVGCQGQKTRMGIVNGLSYAAHQQTDPDLMVDLETWAGSVLVDRDSLFGRAQQAIVRQEDLVEVEV